MNRATSRLIRALEAILQDYRAVSRAYASVGKRRTLNAEIKSDLTEKFIECVQNHWTELPESIQTWINQHAQRFEQETTSNEMSQWTDALQAMAECKAAKLSPNEIADMERVGRPFNDGFDAFKEKFEVLDPEALEEVFATDPVRDFRTRVLARLEDMEIGLEGLVEKSTPAIPRNDKTSNLAADGRMWLARLAKSCGGKKAVGSFVLFIIGDSANAEAYGTESIALHLVISNVLPQCLSWSIEALRTVNNAGTRKKSKARGEVLEQPLTEDFVPSDYQEKILEALDGKALRKIELAKLIGCEERKLFHRWTKDGSTKRKGILAELVDEGLVKNLRRIGYYRPHRPPPGIIKIPKTSPSS